MCSQNAAPFQTETVPPRPEAARRCNRQRRPRHALGPIWVRNGQSRHQVGRSVFPNNGHKRGSCEGLPCRQIGPNRGSAAHRYPPWTSVGFLSLSADEVPFSSYGENSLYPSREHTAHNSRQISSRSMKIGSRVSFENGILCPTYFPLKTRYNGVLLLLSSSA